MPFIEPIGNSREDFFEAKLVLGLPWYCPTLPEVVHREDGSKCTEYSFRCDAPEQLGGQQLDPLVLKLGHEHVCYEVLCEGLERRFLRFQRAILIFLRDSARSLPSRSERCCQR